MTQGQVRVRALSLAVLSYTALTTMVTDDFVRGWSPAQNSHAVFTISTLALRTVTLGLLIVIAQTVGERIWARAILGRWIYRSSQGNFGIADIRFVDGGLYYSVRLFKSVNDVIEVLEKKSPVDAVALVHSEMFKYDSGVGVAHSDYHIESTDPAFQSRKGLLVLTVTAPRQMKGQWYSTLDGRTGNLEFLRKNKYKQRFAAGGH